MRGENFCKSFLPDSPFHAFIDNLPYKSKEIKTCLITEFYR